MCWRTADEDDSDGAIEGGLMVPEGGLNMCWRTADEDDNDSAIAVGLFVLLWLLWLLLLQVVCVWFRKDGSVVVCV